MNIKYLILKLKLTIVFLLLLNTKEGFCQSKQIIAMQSFYDSLLYYGVYHPKTSLAIAMFETGFVDPENPPKHFNYFGFRSKNYLQFKDMTSCILYLREWQTKFYLPWRQKNKGKSYYKFLKHIHYCGNMKLLVRKVKKYELWLGENLELTRNVGCFDSVIAR